jgi:hypothetical protein
VLLLLTIIITTIIIIIIITIIAGTTITIITITIMITTTITITIIIIIMAPEAPRTSQHGRGNAGGGSGHVADCICAGGLSPATGTQQPAQPAARHPDTRCTCRQTQRDKQSNEEPMCMYVILEVKSKKSFNDVHT